MEGVLMAWRYGWVSKQAKGRSGVRSLSQQLNPGCRGSFHPIPTSQT
jgi:hypothetical protein